MIRTQISLAQNDYLAAKKEASDRGLSLAELFRLSLKNYLKRPSKKPWMKYAGMVDTGQSNSSQTIDDIVYGGKD